MRHLFAAMILLLAGSLAAFADDRRTERVAFKAGTSAATISDAITGYEFVDYFLGARKGQSIRIELSTDNPSNYFNFYVAGTTPESDTAAFIGSTSGNSYEGILPSDGDVTVRVYLMRSAARRNETAQYKLTVGIK